MTRQISFAIVSDGGTDRVLVPIVQWAIHRIDPVVEILEPEFRKRKGGVKEFLRSYHPGAMLIFVHRDAEGESYETRLAEFDGVDRRGVVPVIPVKMTEAWIAFDRFAIAQAAGKPSAKIRVPSISNLESITDPKKLIENLLLEAAGNPTGRRRKIFKRDIVDRRVDVASLITDFAPLEGLSAFREFQLLLRKAYPYRLR